MAPGVRAHYDRYGFYFADSKTSRAAFLRHSQLGQLVHDSEPGRGPIVDVGCAEGRVNRLLATSVSCVVNTSLNCQSLIAATAEDAMVYCQRADLQAPFLAPCLVRRERHVA